MVTVEVQWTAAHPADVAQAAYFLGLLADERDEVDAELAHSQARLRSLVGGDKVVGLRTLARARAEAREYESKQRELDRLVAALDRRFASHWPSDR